MGTELMAPRKNRFNRNPESEVIANSIIDAYKPSTVEEMQDAIREVFGPMFEAMLKAELDAHLGYAPNSREGKATDNRRNGYSGKKVNTSYGSMDIHVPRDRDGSFEPVIIPKGSHDVSGMEDRILRMYARGMSMRDIAQTVEEIYGFEIPAEQISLVTDRIVEQAKEWQQRPLKPFYTFLERVLPLCQRAHRRGIQEPRHLCHPWLRQQWEERGAWALDGRRGRETLLDADI